MVADTNTRRLDEASFDRVTREMHLCPDDHIVAELEQIVIADEERIHVDAAADAGPVEPEVRGPDR